MLFELHSKPAEDNSKLLVNSHSANFISSQNDYLHKLLKHTDITNDNTAIHFTSDGRFALHDLIIFYARKLEKANVIVSSFNLSQDAARKFIRAWDFGLFNSLKLILNIQKKSNFIKAVRLVEGKFPMKFIKIHSKVAVIWNEYYNITIITSGNLSSNNNQERGVIFFDKKTFDFDFKRMNDVFKID